MCCATLLRKKCAEAQRIVVRMPFAETKKTQALPARLPQTPSVLFTSYLLAGKVR